MGLTALMTLLAGTPHFDCLCADGHTKPFCLNLFASSARCCGESCCLARPEARAVPPQGSAPGNARKSSCCCCCKAGSPQGSRESDRPARLQNTGCQKVFVEAEDAAPAPFAGHHGQVLTLNLLTSAVGSFLPSLALPIQGDRPFDGCHAPPPTDLVTVLQHFLI